MAASLLALYAVSSTATSVLAAVALLEDGGGAWPQRLPDDPAPCLIAANQAVCVLLVLFAGAVRANFGALSAHEWRGLKERVAQFALFKIVVIGFILEVPSAAALGALVVGFAASCWLRQLALVARDRLEQLAVDPTTPPAAYRRLLLLLLGVLAADALVMGWTLRADLQLNTRLMCAYECLALLLEVLQSLVKCRLHAADAPSGAGLYLAEFSVETLHVVLDLGHYLQLWLVKGVSYSLVDAILFLNMRHVFSRMRSRVGVFWRQQRLLRSLEGLFPDATPEELEGVAGDVCAICLRGFAAAKRLPCGHYLHRPCLQRCLLRASQDAHTCPLCRQDLRGGGGGSGPVVTGPGSGSGPVATGPASAPGAGATAVAGVSDADVALVKEIFPHVSEDAIRADIVLTGSGMETVHKWSFEGGPPVAASREGPAPSREAPAPAREAPAAQDIPIPAAAPESFSSDPGQRHRSFQARKEAMKAQARRRFEAKAAAAAAPAPAPALAPSQEAPAAKDIPIPAAAPESFSSDPGQRHRSFQARKEAMKAQARRRFEAKAAAAAAPAPAPAPAQAPPPEDAKEDTPEERRRRFLEAAERRMAQQM